MNQFEVKLHKLSSGFIQSVYRDPKTGSRKRKRFATLKEAKDYKKRVESRVNSKGVNAFNDLRVAQAMKDYIEGFPTIKQEAEKITSPLLLKNLVSTESMKSPLLICKRGWRISKRLET